MKQKKHSPKILSLALLSAVSIPNSLYALSAGEVTNHVQVAFIWTPERESNYGGKNQVISNMRQSWGIVNRALDNTDCGMQFSYIPWDRAVNYTANASNLSVIADLRAGRVPGAHAFRDQAGADVMGMSTLMRAGGLAYIGDPRQYAVRYLTGSSTAHELGHTFGCGHGGFGTNYPTNADRGDKPYAGGLKFNDGGKTYGTVMAGAQILWYSTPGKTFRGRKTGIANIKDNRRRVLETRNESSRIRKTRPEGGRSNGWWYIRNQYSNFYAALKTDNKSNGTRLVQHNRRNTYSLWRFDNGGAGGGWMTIANRGSGKAMDMTGSSSNGRYLHQWTWRQNPTHPNQHAKLDHRDSGMVGIRFRNGNRSLANNGRNSTNGNDLVQWPWSSAGNLNWYLEREHR